jgi:hypothetical protein
LRECDKEVLDEIGACPVLEKRGRGFERSPLK